MLRNIIKKFFHQIRVSLGIMEMNADLNIIKATNIEICMHKILAETRYQNKKRLNQYEQQIFSQFGEDGIIQEIFQRIGSTNKYFLEIGAGNGIENNTTNVLTNGWQGLWIDGNPRHIDQIKQYFSLFIQSKKLQVKNEFVTTENIESMLKKSAVPKEFDFLSIDVDGNDYWIWQALKKYKPRVVAAEYNASLGPKAEWIMKYNANHVYDYTAYHGASLKSLELLGNKMGYSLVGCSLSGVNAFFVRSDLTGDKFLTPYTSENFYETPKYFLYKNPGHPKSYAMFNDYIVK